jgi:replicative DNA helicase
MAEIKAEDFYSEANRIIFEAMYNIYNENRPIDFVTLTSELEKSGNLNLCGGITYITAVTQAVPSSANFRHYVEIVKRDSCMRKLIRASGEIAEMAQSDADTKTALEFAEKSIFDISISENASKVIHIKDSIVEVIDKFDKIQSDRDSLRGIPTGFPELDRMTNGLQRSDLIIIAARPAVGKTSFALNIVENAALKGAKSCAIFSLEMPNIQISQRLLCSVSEVSISKALKGKLEKDEWVKLWKESDRLAKSKIFIDDSSLITPAEILSKCRRIKMRDGLDLIMIDYIQLMSSGKKNPENRQSEIADITRRLKIIAKEIDVPVIALSQLSRTVEKNQRRPILSDLRESGAIEQDADVVMFLHRPEEKDEGEKNVVELSIAKHRNGPVTGAPIELKWFGEYTKFREKNRVADEAAKAYGIN